MLHSVWANHHVGIVRSILPDDDNQVIVTGGEDGKIHLWDDVHFNSTRLQASAIHESMDVDTDVDMDDLSSSSSRKRDRDGDEPTPEKKARYRR